MVTVQLSAVQSRFDANFAAGRSETRLQFRHIILFSFDEFDWKTDTESFRCSREIKRRRTSESFDSSLSEFSEFSEFSDRTVETVSDSAGGESHLSLASNDVTSFSPEGSPPASARPGDGSEARSPERDGTVDFVNCPL
jgi:hypothetical protein